MKQKLENILCIMVLVGGVCSLIAMFLLTHPKLFKSICNEVQSYSVVELTNVRTLPKGGNVLHINYHQQNEKSK